MSATTFPRSRRQSMTALEQANEVRFAQRDWKIQMAAKPRRQACEEAARILREDPGSVGALTIHAFLVAIPLVGEGKAQALLTNRQEGWYIWPFRRVRDLTDRQRCRLAELLEAGR